MHLRHRLPWSERSRRPSAPVRVLAALVGLVGPALLGAAPAAAHANLVRVEPADGATVAEAPGQVRLVFDENVRAPAAIVVTGPSGDRVERGGAEVLDNTASVDVVVDEAGVYTVAFRVVSADGHPVSRQTSFEYVPGGTTRPGSAAPSAGSTHAGHAGHDSADDAGGGLSSTRVVGILAGTALLLGLGLLTVRRLPGGLVDPRKERP